MTYQTDPQKQKEIDEILMKVATIQSNLGIDSTDHERIVAKSKKGVLLNKIKDIDSEFYKILVP